jgi:hypothetical protein
MTWWVDDGSDACDRPLPGFIDSLPFQRKSRTEPEQKGLRDMLRGDEKDIDERELETFHPARIVVRLTLKTKTTKTL